MCDTCVYHAKRNALVNTYVHIYIHAYTRVCSKTAVRECSTTAVECWLVCRGYHVCIHDLHSQQLHVCLCAVRHQKPCTCTRGVAPTYLAIPWLLLWNSIVINTDSIFMLVKMSINADHWAGNAVVVKKLFLVIMRIFHVKMCWEIAGKSLKHGINTKVWMCMFIILHL